MQETIITINTIGLTLGFIGAFILIMISPQLIQINKSGTVSMGPDGVDPEAWRKKNRRLRAFQVYLAPACYFMIALGFGVQLFGLWLPKICGQ